jgi:hypothetical protein
MMVTKVAGIYLAARVFLKEDENGSFAEWLI